MAKWKIAEDKRGQRSFIAELSDDMSLEEIMQMVIEHQFEGTDDVDEDLALLPEEDGSLCLVDGSGYPYAYLTRYTAPTFGSAVAQAEAGAASRPRCPTCGSTDITKLGVASRLVSGAIFGELSVEGRAQFRCGKCGYVW